MVRHEPCPRCGGQLIGWNDSDTSCLQCGHVVYPRSTWSSELLGQDIDLEREAEPVPPDGRKRRKPE